MATRGGMIGIDIRGIEPLVKYLDDIAKAKIAEKAAEDVSKYLVDVLKLYPPQKYVTRADAYPEVGGFFSERQRRWFFAALASGELSIPYRRTQGFAQAWQIVGSGANIIIVNDTEAADYIMGPGQSRHEAMVGWKQLPAILKEREKRITEIIEGVAKRYLKH